MECPERDTLKPKKDLSLSSLILWNIKKVMEMNASVNLKDAMQSAYQHLEEGSYDVNTLMAQGPEEQHLACAILAWQRLGHGEVDSLINFIQREKRSREMKKASTKVSFKSKDSQEGECSKNIMGPSVIGPVVRLPVETKIVMHMENPCARHQPKKKPQKDIISKIEPCCMDSACIKRLTDLDAATGELRKRAARLAKREAERVELLERAEAAWRDLEVGYQRRLTLAEEKEGDLTKEIKKLIEDRNNYKSATNALIKQLKERSVVVEKERKQLTEIEKEVCNRACERLRLSEQASQGDAAMAELHCRSTQLDRELLYKEEQARRKVIALENEIDSIRGLTLEAERAMRSELSALKEQMMDVSKQLLVEEAKNNKVKAELEEMRQEKMNIIEDLEGCKDMCDGRIQKRVDVLKNRREELNELKNRVIECECKLPQDAAVEVKRTPSLAALCYCQPEDRALDACSCMSLRSQLLSNLLSDLFSGLQSELGGTKSQMPCQLLKCLEDRHNWDRGSLVKTNLRNFFAQLLIGELDIAIATSIEKYHAKWVGARCTDHLRAVSGHDEDEGWQDRAIERRAQKLATQLAEQLFKERADLMAQKAKDIMNTGPPPCECKPQQNAAVYPCLVKTQNPNGRKVDGTSSYLKKTIQDVTNMKSQIENLKKESIKKEDLRQMEDKLARIIQRVSKQDNKKGTLNSNKIDKKISNDETTNKVNILKSTHVEPIQTRKSNRFQSNISGRVEKYSNKMNLKKKDPSVAVNLCLCDPNKTKEINAPNNSKSSWKPNFLTELTSQISTVKLSKPIVTLPKSSKASSEKKFRKKACPSKCVCLHKIPSNKSIDKLLNALKNWKFKLDDSTFAKAMETDGMKRSPFDISNGNRQTKDSNNVNDNPIEDNNNKQKLDYLPLSTLSEYMGAVNLDKSYENVCKCVPDVANSSDKNPLSNFKCISANLCACKEVNKEKPHEKKSQVYTVNVTDPAESRYESSIKEAGIQKDSFIDKIVKDSDFFSYDCEYDIKFLGATLTDNRSTNPDMQSRNELVPDNINLNRTSNKDKFSRSDTYDNLRRLFDNDIIKCDKVDRLSNISKPTKESCICCNDTEQQNDLECNTFNLLEDYLRDRLNQFKTSCKSSCIQPKDEEKLYSTVLNKVKDFISINTDKVSCKCLKPCEGDDRWTRVYGLLQEYLNMKIQRVQCTCLKRDEPSALPNVLDEVTNLINNDFKKLKDLCVCERKPPNDEPATKASVRFSEKETVQTPVKKEMSSFTTDVCVLNTSCSPITSINSRVNVEMVEKVTSCKFNDLYVTDCKCRNAFTEPCFLGVAVNEETEIPSLSNVDLKSSTTSKGVYSNIELKQPYIGYTLNCSCDNYLGCVCTKSLVQTKDDKINLIWNSFSKVYPEKLSYIMRAVPLIKSEHNSFGKDFLSYTTEDLKDDEYFDVKESECQTQTSNEGDISLKKSADVINKSNNDTNTEVKESASSHQSFVTVPNDEDILTNKNTLYNSLFLPVDNLGSIKSDSSSKSDDCECNMVPICHVKLLVENIEYNLKNSNCICDAMSSQVCPIHKSVKVI